MSVVILEHINIKALFILIQNQYNLNSAKPFNYKAEAKTSLAQLECIIII